MVKSGWFGWARRRAVAVTGVGAGAVLAAGIMVIALGVPGSHAAVLTPVAKTVRHAARAHADVPTAPLQITSISPAAWAHGVNGAAPVRVVFSEPLAANSPMPSLSPWIAGSWHVSGNTAVFTPIGGYQPHTKVTLTVPGGASGIVADGAAGSSVPGAGLLSSGTKETFTAGSFSELRLQQLLAELGYLPLDWSAASDPAHGDATGQLSAAYSPPSGDFTWQAGYPKILHTFWHKGSDSLIQQGAIRAFEADQGLTMDGTAGTAVWRHLLTAIARGQRNPHGYTYAVASKASPETLTIWHNGRVVVHTLANTGVPGAPTANGTFPVYLRYYYQIMKGTNLDGSKYADPVSFVAYFNGGDAVHYFPRASFGYPQSLGCVELPWDQAKKAWPYLTYGSLVTVQG